ncbi:DNA mismatch repair protein MutL [Nibricoccus aquaticus]|uniref:DNA mismatch repair protein MutL n=1 Tax=Nibricoccus aquaticus TaxID=2576891 RepID=A0A290QBH2_9BACT|nr:DNA mismatch repair endonuclease MutL [Nibricoccus aquaticus]ATC65597.1 DNA mismatch repair protein MutL [Nibricoccus aquaticus]
MAKVRLLSDRVANQIAAGEVIERPAAVVKELVENALDAGATRVEVEFRHGGRSLMRIEDNGHGMSKDDALMALERHATSKIEEADDLNRLASFGFRGEALPSIASVSRFELQTREAGSDVGTEILVNGGKFVHVRECGRPVGTRIEVTHLFNSVPARRKFLKTDATEAAHIIQGVRLYALAFPGVAFSLIEDGRVIFKSPQCATLAERVTEIFGRQVGEGLVPLDASEQGMKVSGLIGRPGQGRSTRHEMIVFINQRPVDSRTLNYALIESYHESLPKGRYPSAFVFFEIDPAAVDVNVHPAKREVRFRSESQVRSFVIRSVLARLRELSAEASAQQVNVVSLAGNGEVVRPAMSTAVETVKASSAEPGAGLSVSGGESGKALVAPVPAFAPQVSVRDLRPVVTAGVFAAQPVVAVPQVAAGNSAAVTPTVPVGKSRAWRYLGLAHGSYALFETAAGLVLLDRRAAHERIWFERLQAQFRAGETPVQRLLFAVPLELDPVATALMIDRLAFFNGHGFEIAEFGRGFFRIESVPAWMEPADAEPFVRDLLGALRDGRMQDKNVDVARDELARLAVTKAIRLPDTTSESEMQSLVAQLFACETPLTSPAGRPTQIELGHGELARRFQK